MDLAGPVRPKSLGGAPYILNLFDIYTRFSWTIVLKAKSEAQTKIKEWIPVAERQAGTKLQVIRSDNGGEFLPLAFISWLKLHGVTQQTTPPRYPESNGLAERLNRTLQDKCRTMMVAAKVPGYLWAEFYDAANTLRNLTPVTNLPLTPLEMWAGSKPDLSKLRVLGCSAFCQIDKSQRGGKFEPLAYKGVLVTSAAIPTECGIQQIPRSTTWENQHSMKQQLQGGGDNQSAAATAKTTTTTCQ